MLTRFGLVAAALVSGTIAFAGVADAGAKLKFRYYAYDPAYDYYYGPEYIPEPRYYRYFRRDRPAYLYEDDRDDYDDYAYDPDYYEPEYIPPRKRKTYAKPQIQERPSAAKKKPAAISCSKAGEIVSGYGFKSVKQVTCSGKVYAFNATRDGKPFSVKLNSSSGELTEVKKR
ncbi:hypothetical protein G5V57_03760 [Nordella sp. HKS 07]|uniref:hypothetical protein n=1 Tax=Nordella sp. HKS 07 TaxID=2712222 RepID=UPI0013E1785A|nr:hypothetical protein [Nordella sp. HKS 07]QIG46941.1 hypothetical protein G5V57_03760 [Nordella sp. HKS 07]